MGTFSIGDAIGSGFRLIGRQPLTVLAWGVAYFILAALPTMAVFAYAAPIYIEFFRTASHMTPGGPPPMMPFAQQLQMQMLQPIFFLASLVGRAVLTCAIFRAVLEPERRGFFYLRLSGDEALQGLLQIVLGVLFAVIGFVAALVLIIPMVVVGVSVASSHSEPSPLLIFLFVAAVLAVMVSAVWVGLRLSMAAPMTFAEKKFRLFESWKVTHGQGWKLLGMGLILCVIVGAITIVLEIAGVAIVMASIGNFDAASIKATFNQPPDVIIRTIAPFVIGASFVGSILGAAFMAIFLAPWAEAYRSITGATEASAAQF